MLLTISLGHGGDHPRDLAGLFGHRLVHPFRNESPVIVPRVLALAAEGCEDMRDVEETRRLVAKDRGVPGRRVAV